MKPKLTELIGLKELKMYLKREETSSLHAFGKVGKDQLRIGDFVLVRPMGKRSHLLKIYRTEIVIGEGSGGLSSRFWQLDDPYVSESHARIVYEKDEYWIEDRGSKNGLFLDGVRVKRARLHRGAKIQIGLSRLEMIGPSGASCEGSKRSDFQFERFGFQTASPEAVEALSLVSNYARSSLPVLIYGESGCGKELIARGVHREGLGEDAPFVSVNCAAFSENLLESELFGHLKGAFTGASSQRDGAFVSAHRGTLFLDEIAELSFGLQAKLLRALELGEIKPVGADRPRKVKVRLVAATHRSLWRMVQEGHFRKDLYFRLAVLDVKIPSLRHRPKDIELLARFFARAEETPISDEAIHELQARSWPGNVRQLKNTICRAAVLSGKKNILPSHLGSEPPSFKKFSRDFEIDQDVSANLKEIERMVILNTLERTRGNRTEAAQQLGIAKSTLFQKLRNYGVKGAALVH